MELELLVFSEGKTAGSFTLKPGIHRLGSSPTADLLLSLQAAPSDICRIDVSPDDEVRVRSLDDEDLTSSLGERGPELSLPNGQLVLIKDLRLVLVQRRSVRDIYIEEHPELRQTERSPGVRPPTREPLALVVRAGRELQVLDLDQPEWIFGHGPGAVAFAHPAVSRRHARIFQMPDGFWIEDLGSLNGTYLDGVKIARAQLPPGKRVQLSPSFDAPELMLMTRADAYAQATPEEATRDILGGSDRTLELRKQIHEAARVDFPVLITGETGSGKEGVARALWHHRGRERPFRALNCSAVTDTLFEAAIFGHKRGAFTGAVADAPGLVEQAGDGVLFLDEMGELTLANQAKLLRLLSAEREYQRVGDSTVRQMKARLVCATHRNLEQMVKEGTFRADLYERFAVLQIRVPPLRARATDIPRLAEKALREGGPLFAAKTFSPRALEKLIRHDWPRNVRQLINTVQRAALRSPGDEIQDSDIDLAPAAVEAEPSKLELLEAHDAALERAVCAQALEKARSVRAAAKLCGDSETTFRRRLKRLGLLPVKEGESS